METSSCSVSVYLRSGCVSDVDDMQCGHMNKEVLLFAAVVLKATFSILI